MFLFQPTGLFLSLKQPQNPKRWGQISHKHRFSQHHLRTLPLLPRRLPQPIPSPHVAASQLLAGKECVVLPGMLAAAPPLGSEIRTIWWSEGSQDGAQRDSFLSLVAAPRQLGHRAWGGRHGETAPVQERLGPGVFETQSIPEFTLLPSFSCFCTCFFQGLLGFVGLVGEPGIMGEKVSHVGGNV